METAAPPMPVLLTSRQGSGCAFEVPIKNPEGAKMMTPAKKRLEGYGELRSPPRAERKTPAGDKRLRKEELAEKARDFNEKVRLTAERVRIGLDESAEAKRRDLEQDQEAKRLRREAQLASVMQRLQRQQPEQEVQKQSEEAILRQKAEEVAQKIERASEKRKEALAGRSSKAGRHVEEVKTKKEVVQQHKAEEAAAREKHMAEALAAKAALHDAAVAQLKERAGHHVEAVQGKVQKHLQEVQKHNEELMAKHRQKCGSKIDGRLHNCVVEANETNLTLASSTQNGRNRLERLATSLAGFLPCPP
jgi:hypothetical protein